MLKKIKEYLKSNLGIDDLTETELSYATQLTKEIILGARQNSFKTGDKLISITGEEYAVVKIQNNQYSLLNTWSGEISPLVFDSLSELTLACNAYGLIKYED